MTNTKQQNYLTKLSSYFEITGPSLPYGLSASAMTESPDGKGVLLFGGFNGEDSTREILELRGGTNWTILDVNLQERKWEHTVIPIL